MDRSPVRFLSLQRGFPPPLPPFFPFPFALLSCWLTRANLPSRQRLLGELYDRGVSREDIERTLGQVPFVSCLEE